MKTTKCILTILAIFIVTVGIATEKPKMNIVPLKDKKAIVSAVNANATFFEITVENKRGDIVYYKRTENPTNNYQQVFNFSNLENGNYAMKIKVDDTTLAQNFKVTDDSVTPEESRMYFDPYFSYNNNQLKFTYLNFDKENVNLEIFNAGKMIYEKKLGNNFNINDGCDLSKLEAGSYQVVLYSLNHEYVYDLKK